MVTVFQAIILGLVQGITEWLPVSSSGHLVIFQQLFGLQVPVLFDVLLHLGTLLVILLVFWRDILGILEAILRLDFKSEYGRLFLFIVVGSIPTLFIGLVFHELLVSFFSNLLVVGIGLIITGTLLFFCERKIGNKELNEKSSLVIGISQGIAIIPGISRSGSTIGTGLLLGIDRDKVTRFSFLLSIPAVIGAALLEAKNFVWSDFQLLPLLVDVFVSSVVGYLSLKFLLRFVKERRLRLFSRYCWLVGILIFVFYFLV